MNMIYIVGSGPAGVACAHALLSQGLEVTMLDSGIELEGERTKILEKLSNTKPENWDLDLINTIKGNTVASASGSFFKGVYGSDFPYRETDTYLPYETKNVQPRVSLAKGGLSNIWGAAVLPYLDEDIKDWPISVKDLAPYYESVLSFMDMAAVNDDLANKFPLYSKTYQSLISSNQTVDLMKDLKVNKNILNKRGFLFGHSRLAVHSKSTNGRSSCVYCGLCHYGCPVGAIYNSSGTLEELKKNKNFHYIKDVIVQKIAESNGTVKIFAASRLKNESVFFTGTRVYLACGVISTTKILLKSLEAYDRELTIKDSQWFLIPLIRYKKSSGVVNEKLYTLSQLFVELFDSNLSKNVINLQFYMYNDLFLNAIKNILGFTYPIFKFPLNELLDRLMLIMGYLHSDSSSTFSIKLQEDKLVMEAKINKNVNKTISGVYKKIFENRNLFKAIPVPGITKIPKPGYGSHSGGSFPMRLKPKDFETDTLGRPTGFSRVHVIDSTIFPSIPATTITLTVMANAYRIASGYNDI